MKKVLAVVGIVLVTLLGMFIINECSTNRYYRP